MPVFLDELSKDIFNPRIAGFNEVADALLRARDRVISGGEDIDTVLADAQTEVTAILAGRMRFNRESQESLMCMFEGQSDCTHAVERLNGARRLCLLCRRQSGEHWQRQNFRRRQFGYRE